MKVDVRIYRTIVVLIIGISRVCSNYIYYKNLNRQCSAVFNCGRGYEIVPCKTQFTTDLCTPCKEGFVQPDLISSTGDLNASSCFKPSHQCLAHDLTYSRIQTDAFCDSLSGCKCDNTKCYYGDPCLCYTRDECDNGHFMKESGECIPCPEGTEKNHTGCGPCKHIGRNVPVEKPKADTNLSLSSKSTIYVTKVQTGSPVTPMKVSTGRQEEKNVKLLIILIITFSVAVLILSIVIIIICTKRAGIIVFGGICWTNADIRQRERQDEEANQIRMEGQPFLAEEKRQDALINERQTDGGNMTANPVDDKNSQGYKNNSNSEPFDSCSSSGYEDGEHLDHSFEEHERCSLNNESEKNKTENEKDNLRKTDDVGPLRAGKVPIEMSVNREESVKQKINKAKSELKPLNVASLTDKENTGYMLSEKKKSSYHSDRKI